MSDAATTALLEACLKAMRGNERVSREVITEIAELRLEIAETKQVRDDMKAVLKIVRDGNGKPSLLQRVHDLEQAAADKAQSRLLAAQGSEKKWDRWAMMAMAVLSALTTLWVAFHANGGIHP